MTEKKAKSPLRELTGIENTLHRRPVEVSFYKPILSIYEKTPKEERLIATQILPEGEGKIEYPDYDNLLAYQPKGEIRFDNQSEMTGQFEVTHSYVRPRTLGWFTLGANRKGPREEIKFKVENGGPKASHTMEYGIMGVGDEVLFDAGFNLPLICMEVNILPTPADEQTYKRLKLDDLRSRGLMSDDEINDLKKKVITNPIQKNGTCGNCGKPAPKDASWCGSCDANKPINFFK